MQEGLSWLLSHWFPSSFTLLVSAFSTTIPCPLPSQHFNISDSLTYFTVSSCINIMSSTRPRTCLTPCLAPVHCLVQCPASSSYHNSDGWMDDRTKPSFKNALKSCIKILLFLITFMAEHQGILHSQASTLSAFYEDKKQKLSKGLGDRSTRVAHISPFVLCGPSL